MGIKDTIDASERYAEYEALPEDAHKERANYLVWDNPGLHQDVDTLYDTVLRRLQSQNIPITSENLEKGFDTLHQAFMKKIASEKDSGMSEQERDLREAMGTNDTDNTDNTESDTKDTGMSEQERDLWDIFHNDDALKSMKRGTGDEL